MGRVREGDERVGRQGPRRPPGGRHVPCSFSLSPLSPPKGEFPPATPSGGSRRRARAFLCSSPVTPPASFPSALGQGRRRPFPLPQGSAPPLLILARCFISRQQVLGFPARCLPLHRFTDLLGRRQCVAVAGVAPRRRSLPAWCTACRAILPRPPCGRRRPSGPGSAPPFRPPGFPRPSAPEGLPVLPPGQAGRPLRGDRPAPPAFCTSPLPGPGRPRLARTAGPRALRPAPRPHKYADAPLGRDQVVLRAVGRQTLRADCLGPPVF